MTKKKGYAFAREASKQSDFHRNPTGAVAIFNGTIIARGWNSEKTSPIQAYYNRFRSFDPYSFKASIHAEMMVISKIQFLDIDFSKVEIYVWRGKEGPQLARPCEACSRAIREMGIKKVYYTGDNSYIKEVYE